MRTQQAGGSSVTKLDNIFDWQHFFERAGMTFKGIAASQSAPDVCHSKRFVRRQDLSMLSLPGLELVVPEMFEEVIKNKDGVVMLTRSSGLVRLLRTRPCLCGLACAVTALDASPPGCAPGTLSAKNSFGSSAKQLML